MRTKSNTQMEFDFQPSTLEITNEYFNRYERISRILDDNPKIVDQVHKDLAAILESEEEGVGRKCKVSSETVLRILISQIIEGESLRGIVIRIDDSNYLRRFVQIYNGAMIDFTTLCTLKNAIQPESWKKINDLLTKAAVEGKLVPGDKARLDT